MKYTKTFLLLAFTLIAAASSGQVNFKKMKVGHVFTIDLPEYMTKTTGLNDFAIFQFQNKVKDIAGVVIEDSKEDLTIANLQYSSINEFYEEHIKDFLKDEKDRNISPSVSKTIGDTKFIECDASYYDKDSKINIYYFVGIVETKGYYYKVFCWSALDVKDKFKADFQKILYSLKD